MPEDVENKNISYFLNNNNAKLGLLRGALSRNISDLVD